MQTDRVGPDYPGAGGALYAPEPGRTLFGGIWSQDEQLHGPIVLAISVWLIYRNWPAMEAAAAGSRPVPGVGRS